MRELWAKSRWIVIAAAGVALAAWAFTSLGGSELPDDPLAMAPEGSTVVARIAVSTVTRSHLYEALLEDEEDDPGVRRIERLCDYDPLEQVEEAVVFLGGTSDRPFEHLGFVARGEMARGRANKERLVECVRRVIREDGGGLRQVEVEGERAIASASGSSHAAFLGSDGVVGGDREVVAQAIRVAHGDAPSARGDAVLARLWERVSTDRDIVAVGRLPRRWLPAIERLTGQLDGDFDALSAIQALGIGVRVRGGLAIGLAAETRENAQARQLEEALLARIDALLSDRLVRLSAVGTALRRVSVDAQDHEVVVTLALSNSQVDDLLELWRDLRRRAREDQDRPPEPPPPDETIEPSTPDAGAPPEMPAEPEPARDERPAREPRPAREEREVEPPSQPEPPSEPEVPPTTDA